MYTWGGLKAVDGARGADLGVTTIADLDLFRAAAINVKRHGEDAPVEAVAADRDSRRGVA